LLNCNYKITWSGKVVYAVDNKNNIPSNAGVYEIQGKKVADGGFTRRYVGITENLQQSYLDHLSNQETNEKLKLFLREKRAFFRYLKSDTERIRKDIEKGLYDKFKHSFKDTDNLPLGSGKYSKIKITETNP